MTAGAPLRRERFGRCGVRLNRRSCDSGQRSAFMAVSGANRCSGRRAERANKFYNFLTTIDRRTCDDRPVRSVSKTDSPIDQVRSHMVAMVSASDTPSTRRQAYALDTTAKGPVPLIERTRRHNLMDLDSCKVAVGGACIGEEPDSDALGTSVMEGRGINVVHTNLGHPVAETIGERTVGNLYVDSRFTMKAATCL